MRLTAHQVNASLRGLFGEPPGPWIDEIILANAANSFTNLAVDVLAKLTPGLLKFVSIDHHRTQLMIKRFYRDVWGVHYCYAKLEELSKNGSITDEAKQSIFSLLPAVGIRINSEHPKKTRIAAAFSLWMSTMKPLAFSNKTPANFKSMLSELEARVNFAIVWRFLRACLKIGG